MIRLLCFTGVFAVIFTPQITLAQKPLNPLEITIASNKKLAKACGFPLKATKNATHPVPIGDGSYYYLTATQMSGLSDDTYDLNTECDWSKIADEPTIYENYAANNTTNQSPQVQAKPRTEKKQRAKTPVQPVSTPRPKPQQVQTANLDQRLDQVISVDARSWFLNKYIVGSAKNTRIVEYDQQTGRTVVYGEYSYNSSSRGWVKVVFNKDQVNCVEYHDFRGTCRAVGRNPAAYRALGVVAAAAVLGSGTSSTGGSSTQNSGRICPTDAISCNSRPAWLDP